VRIQLYKLRTLVKFLTYEIMQVFLKYLGFAKNFIKFLNMFLIKHYVGLDT